MAACRVTLTERGDQMETIETRLRRLERHNRIYRNLFILAGLALVAAGSYGAVEPVPEVIRAKAFHVVREDGQVIGAFESHDGAGHLLLLRRDGKAGIVSVGRDSSNHGPGIGLYNNSDNQIVYLGADQFGHGVVVTYNRNAKGGRRLQSGR